VCAHRLSPSLRTDSAKPVYDRGLSQPLGL